MKAAVVVVGEDRDSRGTEDLAAGEAVQGMGIVVHRKLVMGEEVYHQTLPLLTAMIIRYARLFCPVRQATSHPSMALTPESAVTITTNWGMCISIAPGA